MVILKAPICGFCLKTDLDELCPKCQIELDTGRITQNDVDISRYIWSLRREYPFVDTLNIRRIIEISDAFIIVLKSSLDSFDTKKGRDILKELELKYGKQFKVVKYAKKVKTFINELIKPVKILGINQVWLPDGTIEKLVILNDEDYQKLPISEKTIAEIVEKLFGEHIRIGLLSQIGK